MLTLNNPLDLWLMSYARKSPPPKSCLLSCARVQRSAKVSALGLVNFITALAYHFCPACLQHSRNLVHLFLLISVQRRVTMVLLGMAELM